VVFGCCEVIVEVVLAACSDDTDNTDETDSLDMDDAFSAETDETDKTEAIEELDIAPGLIQLQMSFISVNVCGCG
jgi:hypothetical protein